MKWREVIRASEKEKHVQSIHDGVKHSCEFCDFKATTKDNLQAHVHSVHEGVKYSCECCDYIATTKATFEHICNLSTKEFNIVVSVVTI